MKKQFGGALAALGKSVLIGGLLATANAALAAGGGLSKATQEANNFQVWEYGFIAVVATCYLGYEGVRCFTNKGSWLEDFGAACVKVAVVGGAGTVAVYLFNIWSS